MIRLYPIGLLIAGLSLFISILHLKQSIAFYVDFVGLMTVFGGTFAVAVIILPWNQRREIFQGLRGLFQHTEKPLREMVQVGMDLVREAETGQFTAQSRVTPHSLAGEVLRDGIEFIQLGFQTDKINSILSERILQGSERHGKIATAVRSLAKYPPAFGLAGTVLGLVSLMRAVSEGAGASEVGVRMSVALVATFYGLLVANLVVNPAGEQIAKDAHHSRKEAEIALQALLLANDRTSLLEAQEMLNSFVPSQDRISALSHLSGSSEAAA